INIKDVEMYNNTANFAGGALYLDENYIVNIDGFSIHDNNSGNLGGAVVANSELNVSRGEFDNNNAIAAGVIYASSVSTKVKAESVVFSNNTATNGSGAIFGYQADIDLTNCTFINNTA